MAACSTKGSTHQIIGGLQNYGGSVRWRETLELAFVAACISRGWACWLSWHSEVRRNFYPEFDGVIASYWRAITG